MSNTTIKAPYLEFSDGKKKELIEEAVRRIVDALNFEILHTTESYAEMLELIKRIETIAAEKIEKIVLNFRKEHCGIPCDVCTENGHCQIGVYAARRVRK